MKTLPSISTQIDEKLINKVIQKNYALLAPSFFTLASNWFIRAYGHFKDIDKFVIIIYLINKDLIFFRKNGLKVDYETFYKNKTLEIDKISISDISKDLQIPKESIRRKILDLEKNGVIKKSGKKIFIVRNTLYSVRATNTMHEIATILHEFNKILKKEKLIDNVYSVNEIMTSMKENFSFSLYQFNKFWFAYINRWKTELNDLEYLCIGLVAVINAVKNKEFNPKKNLSSFHKKLMGSDLRGVNAMSVSEITGIPRPTVVRKLNYLINRKFLHINEKKLISFNAKESAFTTTGKMVNQNMLDFSKFIHRVFNQIKIIKSN